MTQEPRSIPPPRLCSSCGSATLAIVASKACIAVAIINATVACRRIALDSVIAAAVIRTVAGHFVLQRQEAIGLRETKFASSEDAVPPITPPLSAQWLCRPDKSREI